MAFTFVPWGGVLVLVLLAYLMSLSFSGFSKVKCLADMFRLIHDYDQGFIIFRGMKKLSLNEHFTEINRPLFTKSWVI